MLDIEDFWRERTGLAEGAPAEFRRDWERRIVPLLESPSGRWQARMEADELVNSWLLRGVLKLAQDIRGKLRGGLPEGPGNGEILERILEAVQGRNGSGNDELLEKILEAVRNRGDSGSDADTVERMWNWIEKNPSDIDKVKTQLAEMRLTQAGFCKDWGKAGVADKLDKAGVALQAIRNAIEGIGEKVDGLRGSGRDDEILGIIREQNERFKVIQEQARTLAQAMRDHDEREMEKEKPKGLLARIRGNWKMWAGALGVALVLMAGSWLAGWEMRKGYFEHVWVELPQSHESAGSWPPHGYDPGKAKWD